MARAKASTAAGRRRSSTRASTRAGAHPKPARKHRKPAGAGKTAARPKRATRPKASARKSRPARRTTARPRRAARRGPADRHRGFSWPQRLVLIACVGVILTAGYFLWLRDSSLVAVDDVEVVGVTTEREAIVAELTRVGTEMTTLHPDSEAVERVAASFPTIESVTVDPNFPHGLRIEVTERPPVVIVDAGGDEVAAAEDGTLLNGLPVPEEGMPSVAVDELPRGAALEGEPLEQAIVAGAAPAALRPLVEEVGLSKEHGVEIVLRGGIPVYFGDSEDAGTKWAAAAAVLADPKLDYARYVDVRVPARPGVGQDGAVTAPVATNPPA